MTPSWSWRALRAAAVVLFASACNPAPSAEEMKAALEDANYCASTDQCERIGAQCPFGCDIYVNADEADEIRALLSEFDGECYYKCRSPLEAVCVDGSCEPLY